MLSNILLVFNFKIKKVNAISGLGFLFTNSRNSLVKSFIKIIFKFINFQNRGHYIFQNQYDLNIFQKLGVKNNFSLIKGSGVDKKEFQYVKPNSNSRDKLNIVFTGRIIEDKGIYELINAVNYLPEKCKKKIILNIYGKIDIHNPSSINEKDFMKLIDYPYIKWHGFKNQIKKHLINSDIFCFPSYREGLPKSIIEAMAIGRPIITTNAPGCDETVLEAVNGFKVNPKDYKNLSKRIEVLINDSKLRIIMGEKSREIFEKNFTLNKVLNDTLSVYKKI